MKKNSTTGLGGSLYQGKEVLKVLRLKTGETILCELDDEPQDFAYNPTIDLIHPISIITVNYNTQNNQVHGENLMIKPFLMLSDSTRYPISTDVILTMGDMKAGAKRLYKNYLHETLVQRQQDKLDHTITDLLAELNNGRLMIIEHDRDDEYLASMVRKSDTAS